MEKADNIKNEKEVKKKKTETKSYSRLENKANKNEIKATVNKNMLENELRENSKESNVKKYKKERTDKKHRKLNIKRCSLALLKAHSKNPNKSVKFISHIIEDNLKDVSKHDVKDLMEIYMTYVNYRNYRNYRKERCSRNPNTVNRSLEKTFSAIFTCYGEWLESFMGAYEKWNAKIMKQTKRHKGRRPEKKALSGAGRQTNLKVNATENIRKDVFDGTIELEITANMTDVTSSEVNEVSPNSGRKNTPRGKNPAAEKEK